MLNFYQLIQNQLQNIILHESKENFFQVELLKVMQMNNFQQIKIYIFLIHKMKQLKLINLLIFIWSENCIIFHFTNRIAIFGLCEKSESNINLTNKALYIKFNSYNSVSIITTVYIFFLKGVSTYKYCYVFICNYLKLWP